MKKISFLIIFLVTYISFSQNEFQLEVDLGYSFQREMILNNESLKNTSTLGVRFGANYIIMVNDKLYNEIGIYGRFNRGNKKIENLKFTSNSLKIQLPVYLGYKIDDVWRFSLGVGVENNKDFDQIDFKRKYNLRYDFLTKLVFVYDAKVQFSFYTNWMLNSIPDTFTISNPKNGIYLGIILSLGKS